MNQFLTNKKASSYFRAGLQNKILNQNYLVSIIFLTATLFEPSTPVDSSLYR